MTLTPQQRLEAYEWAKEQLKSRFSIKLDNGIGLCSLMLIWQINKGLRQHVFMSSFFELKAQKPEGTNVYWWPLGHEGYIQRLAALDRAIELVKEKI